jgi:uncharacterized surface protein with fasciclin (FAS1) repeats
MKSKFLSTLLTLCFVSMLHFSCSSPTASLLSTLGGNSQLSGITSLLKGAGGLGNIMGSKGPFTLLAPTNDALSKLGQGSLENLLKPENKSMLTDVLKKHVLPGKFSPDQIKAGGLKDAVGNVLNLGGANITESIPTKGGLIQVIDKVLQ